MHLQSLGDSFEIFYVEIYERKWYRKGLLIASHKESREEYLKRLCKETPL
jgi:hypothetical protein